MPAHVCTYTSMEISIRAEPGISNVRDDKIFTRIIRARKKSDAFRFRMRFVGIEMGRGGKKRRDIEIAAMRKLNEFFISLHTEFKRSR